MPDMERLHRMSVRCFYANTEDYTKHFPEIAIDDIPKWVKAYWYTHPNLQSISVKIWMEDAK